MNLKIPTLDGYDVPSSVMDEDTDTSNDDVDEVQASSPVNNLLLTSPIIGEENAREEEDDEEDPSDITTLYENEADGEDEETTDISTTSFESKESELAMEGLVIGPPDRPNFSSESVTMEAANEAFESFANEGGSLKSGHSAINIMPIANNQEGGGEEEEDVKDSSTAASSATSCAQAKWHLSTKLGICSNSPTDFPTQWLDEMHVGTFMFDTLKDCCDNFFKGKEDCVENVMNVCLDEKKHGEAEVVHEIMEGNDTGENEQDVEPEVSSTSVLIDEEEVGIDGEEDEPIDSFENDENNVSSTDENDTIEEVESEGEGGNEVEEDGKEEEESVSTEVEEPNSESSNNEEDKPSSDNTEEGPEFSSDTTEGQGAEINSQNTKTNWEGFDEDFASPNKEIDIVQRDKASTIVSHDVSELKDVRDYEGDGYRFHVLHPKNRDGGNFIFQTHPGVAVIASLLAMLILCFCRRYCRGKTSQHNRIPNRGKYSALHGSDDYFNGTFSDDISFHGKDSDEDDDMSVGSYDSDDGAYYSNGKRGGATLEMGMMHEADANGGLTLDECNG